MELLSSVGVSNPSEFASLNVETIQQTVSEWQRQNLSTGVLVHRLRQAARNQQTGRTVSLADREAEYGRQVVAWLGRNFPELCDEHGPHPAAFTAVLRLHFRHGKGSLTRAEHGPAIEAAVAAFDQRHSLFDNNQTKE